MKRISNTFYALREFFDINTLYYASSLSFFTIFAFFPILDLILVITTSYFDVADATMLINNSLEFINPTSSLIVKETFLAFASSAVGLGVLGIVYLAFIFVIFFNDYEHIVNKIHHTKKRTFLRVFFAYLTTLIVLCFSFSVLAFANFHIKSSWLLDIFAYVFYYLFLVVILKVSINKKTNTKVLFVCGFIMYNVLKITKVVFLYAITINTSYITLYGGFSTILFTLLWVYVFWVAYLYSIKLYHYADTNKIPLLNNYLPRKHNED